MRCIQKYNPMAKTEKDLDNVVLSIRLRGADATRFWNVMDIAKERNPYADRSDVIRELLGLAKLDLLTEKDIHYFRTGKKKGVNSNINQTQSKLIQVPHKGKLDDDTQNQSGKKTA